jgi:hypothetical protein
MIGQLLKSEAGVRGEQVLQRIAWLTLGFGFAFAALAMTLERPDWAKGLAGGAVLGWLNFRWLSRGVRAMMNAALAQAPAPAEAPASGGEQPLSGPKSNASLAAAIFTLLFRYALVGCGVYVIFIYLHVPLVSIGLGLCALVAAIMAASVWEVVRPAS